MKIDNQRVTGKDLIEGYNLSQTRIISFSTEEQTDIFGIKTSDIPKTKNAIAGGPDLITCIIRFTIDRKEEKIKFDSMSVGVDVYGENPHSEIDSIQIGHWLPIAKTGFKKYEVNTETLSTDYPCNEIIDELKLQVYKRAR